MNRRHTGRKGNPALKMRRAIPAVFSVFVVLSFITGLVTRVAIADSPRGNDNSAAASTNVRITIPTSINIGSFRDISLDIPSISVGAIYGCGKLSVDSNYSAGVSVTDGYSGFRAAISDAIPANITIDRTTPESVITVTLAFGSGGMATTGNAEQLAVNFAVESTGLAHTGDDAVNVALLNIVNTKERGIAVCTE